MPPDRDLYEILGVPRGSSPDEIKKAYRKLARRHHPDVNPGNKAAEERFKELAAAFEVLSNPEKRKLYDELGADAQKIGFDPAKAKAYRQWQTSRARPGVHDPFGGSEVPFDLGDLFGDLFAGAGARSGGRGRTGRARPQRSTAPERGEDLHAPLAIELRETVIGGSREFGLERPDRCPTCHGSGVGDQRPDEACATCHGSGIVVGQAKLTIQIPKGTIDGTIIRLAKQGAAGLRGGPPGDLLLEAHLRPHPWIRINGRDLSFDLPVTVGEALRGGEVAIPTFEGDLRLTVPPASQSGRQLRLRGRGLPHPHGTPGDLYAVIQVTVPRASGAEVERLATEIDRLYTGGVRDGLRL